MSPNPVLVHENEYTLTTDERELIEAIALPYQQAYQAELNTVLRAIIRHRKLPEGAWNLADDRLTRAE